MMKDKRNGFGKQKIQRKQIMITIISCIGLGVIMGICCHQAITTVLDESEVNLTLCMLIFIGMIVFLWTPLFFADSQVYDLNDCHLQVIPKMNMFQKWTMILHVLVHDDITSYLQTIPITSFTSGYFYVDRHVGSWAFSRYTYVLTLRQQGKDITIYINPMDNGVFLPAGRGGFGFMGCKTREEILQLIQFFEVNQIPIEDPYHIQDALRNTQIEMYDYLESLDIKIRY